MDTLVLMRNKNFAKITERILTLSVIASVLWIHGVIISTPMQAKDLRIAQRIESSVNFEQLKDKVLIEISPEARKLDFENRIKQK